MDDDDAFVCNKTENVLSTLFGAPKGWSPPGPPEDWNPKVNSSRGVIGHGIVGKDIPIMARLAEARRWSKQ